MGSHCLIKSLAYTAVAALTNCRIGSMDHNTLPTLEYCVLLCETTPGVSSAVQQLVVEARCRAVAMSTESAEPTPTGISPPREVHLLASLGELELPSLAARSEEIERIGSSFRNPIFQALPPVETSLGPGTTIGVQKIAH